MSSGFAALCLLLLRTGALGFGLLSGKSLNHQEITETAILKSTLQVCRALAQAEGTDFTFPAKPFTAKAVAVACGEPQSSKSFRQAIIFIMLRNVRVDIRHALNGSFHFDDEMFVGGRKIITEGLLAVKASNKQENFEAARQKLGEILHPLQDFYSHSNWVELETKLPNSNLIRSDTSIGNIADKSRATCRNCDGDDCRNNILRDIIEEKVLTSGYFGVVPLLSTKPKGKCSHGGAVDQTSNIEPKGGINKDTFSSSHGHLHTDAANLAIAATSGLLEDIQGAAGDRPFLQMLGISKGSSKALCFVIDTTGSMSDDIAAVMTVTSSIIKSKVGTEDEPSVYILVSFNDPDFGPLIKTTDPNVFKSAINSLSAAGGGDEGELSLSGLQLALIGAPSNSEVFLFTDAPAKDKHLKSTVIALIERTQTVVNFMISESTVLNRRKRSDDTVKPLKIAASDAQLYRDLAQASGGLAIEVTKNELPVATSIITESSSSSLVTLLQAARSPGKSNDFTFIVDETVTNLRVYITARSLAFTLTSPTGESQQSTDATGSLITASQSVGNFKTLQLKRQVGLWKIKMVSSNPYTLKVIGQSPIDFLFDFVEASQGPLTGYDALDTRPRAGVNGSLLVTLTGSDSATVTEVALVKSSGSEIKGVVEPQGGGSFLVHVDMMPSVEFVVRVKGQDVAPGAPSIVFQRQSSTNFRASNLTVMADSDSILVPGTPFFVPFSVMTSGVGGNFTIRATNNQRFHSTSPTNIFLETGSSANGTVTLSAPLNTPSGSDVTLTIEVEAPGGEDTNYVVLRFSIFNTVTDFTPPVCELLSMRSDCSDICILSMWELSVRVTDGAEGTGVERVSLRRGNGAMTSSPAQGNENITLVAYTSSCCSPDMELLVVDRVGNVGTCLYTNRGGSAAAFSSSTNVVQLLLFVWHLEHIVIASEFQCSRMPMSPCDVTTGATCGPSSEVSVLTPRGDRWSGLEKFFTWPEEQLLSSSHQSFQLQVEGSSEKSSRKALINPER
ncbi:von Willebrand factor A domain-containing protein 7-like [Lycodopsis pacificus]